MIYCQRQGCEALPTGLMQPDDVADAWESWCGETAWSKAMRKLTPLGAKVKWYDGFPRSASAIPLCFVVYGPDGAEVTSGSRLKDLRSAIEVLEGAS